MGRRVNAMSIAGPAFGAWSATFVLGVTFGAARDFRPWGMDGGTPGIGLDRFAWPGALARPFAWPWVGIGLGPVLAGLPPLAFSFSRRSAGVPFEGLPIVFVPSVVARP